MLSELRAGLSRLVVGSKDAVRGGPYRELIVADGGLGRYLEAVRNDQVFLASTQAAVALTTTLSTTATGWILTNPPGSKKNLVLLDLSVALASAPAGVATIGLGFAFHAGTETTHGTPLTVLNASLGKAGTGVGKADNAATLAATPVCVRAVPGGPVAAASIVPPFMRDEVSGLLVLRPGATIATFCLTTAISALISWMLAEVDE